eukprot:7997734-Pyramimonas_sp.AAC.1
MLRWSSSRPTVFSSSPATGPATASSCLYAGGQGTAVSLGEGIRPTSPSRSWARSRQPSGRKYPPVPACWPTPGALRSTGQSWR